MVIAGSKKINKIINCNSFQLTEANEANLGRIILVIKVK